MTKITFQRHERVCVANTKERDRALVAKRKPKLIIDWQVMINGEHRATFQSWGGMVGWSLRDPLDRDIKWWTADKRLAHRRVGKQDFTTIVQMSLPIIPTVADIELERDRIAREKVAKEEAERLSQIEWRRKEGIIAATTTLSVADWRLIVEALHRYVDDSNNTVDIADVTRLTTAFMPFALRQETV